MHAAGTCLVGGGGDHTAFGRVAVTADHHRAPAQFGMPQHLDRRDELVEVGVQDPQRHAFSLAERGRAGGAGSRLGRTRAWQRPAAGAAGRCYDRSVAVCQYPYPPPPEEAFGLAAGAACPVKMIACQTPPDRLSPLPLSVPGAVSPM